MSSSSLPPSHHEPRPPLPDLKGWTAAQVGEWLSTQNTIRADHALRWAAERGRKEVWEAALVARYGAGPTTFICPEWLDDPLRSASHHCSERVVRSLLHLAVHHHPTLTRDALLGELLKSAAVQGDGVALNTWLKLGANPLEGQSAALYAAACAHHWPLVLTLLSLDDLKSSVPSSRVMEEAMANGQEEVLNACRERAGDALHWPRLFHAALKQRSVPHMIQAIEVLSPTERASLVNANLVDAVLSPSLLECMLPFCTSPRVLARAFWLAIRREDQVSAQRMLPALDWSEVWAEPPSHQATQERAAALGPLELQREWAKTRDLPNLRARLLAFDRDTESQEQGPRPSARPRHRP